jgi:hypothetical protein
VISAIFQLYHSTINQRTDNTIGQKKKEQTKKNGQQSIAQETKD